MEKVLLSGFEPESKPRKGLMIGRYTTGAKILFKFPGLESSYITFSRL